MKIAILGRGRIGSGLGRSWSEQGHEVVYGVRAPSADDERSVEDAVHGAEVVVLALPHKALDSVLPVLSALRDAIVVDCTNAIHALGAERSSSEILQSQLPNARVFKSFNAQGAEIVEDARFGDARAVNFFCGDGDHAREIVQRLVEDAGFRGISVGGLSSARHLEALTALWFQCTKTLGTRQLAFDVLSR